MLTKAARAKFGAARQYLRKGAWSVLDQGLFAGSNFVLHVLLARWLLPADYGAFTIAYSVFLLIGTYHTAVLTEPMLVFGSGRYRARLSEYLAILLQGHGAFALLGVVLLVLTGLYFHYSASQELALAFFGLALAQPFILLLWLVRRACYACLNLRLATAAGALYLVSMLAGLGLLYTQARLSTLTALGIMALASLVASLWITLRLGVRRVVRVDGLFRADIVREHWKYGRWSAGTSLLTWIPGNIYFLLLPLWGGLEATGTLRALQNLVQPVMNFHAALGLILLPSLVRAQQKGTFTIWVRTSAVVFSAVSLGYWLLLGLGYRPILAWLYEGQYVEHGHLLWILAFVPVFVGLTRVFGGALRALERPDRVFWAYTVSAGLSLTVGLACMAIWVIPGAAVAKVITTTATASMLAVFLRRLPAPRAATSPPAPLEPAAPAPLHEAFPPSSPP